MSHCVDECYDVYDERVTRARKTHTCEACKEPIAAGTLYFRVSWVFDRTANTLKRCARCQRLHEHLRMLGDGCMWPDERLACGLKYEDEWGETPDEIAALAFEPDQQAWAAAHPKLTRSGK